jgi:glutamyl-tRNA synthetase/nondiscriminating glutamyl-tRNA synthetase
VGNARTALFNLLLARGAGGTFILRIEDTDAERSTAASEAGILEDLRWLGLVWDEGPDVGGPHGPYRQSERLRLYTEYAARLLASGRAYYCFCTDEQVEADRRDAAARGQQPRYSGRCRALDAQAAASRVTRGEPAAIRFVVPRSRDVAFDDGVRGTVVVSTDVIGDPVIIRSDGRPAYNFAVVVDDALMRVTHVIRGEDHVSNTPRQVLLYEALGLTPPRFSHLSLVMGPDHTPLSKRHGATSVAEFRARGYLPEALVNYLALIGWSPGHDEEILPVAELARRFRIEDVGRSAGVFDVEKLGWMNRHYLKAAPTARVAAMLHSHLEDAGWCRALDGEGERFLESLVPLVHGTVDRLDQAPGRLRTVFVFDAVASLAREDVRAELGLPAVREVIAALADELARAPRLTDTAAFRDVAGRVRARTGQKGRGLFHPVRVALTGESDGPELDLLVPAIDRGASLGPGSGWVAITGCRERAREFVRALRAAGVWPKPEA